MKACPREDILACGGCGCHGIYISAPSRAESEEAAQTRVMDAVTGNGMVIVMQVLNHEKVASCLEEVTTRACSSNIP